MDHRAGRDCLQTGQGEGEEEAEEQVSAHKTAGARPVGLGAGRGGGGWGGCPWRQDSGPCLLSTAFNLLSFSLL